jgi:hypothetical protein
MNQNDFYGILVQVLKGADLLHPPLPFDQFLLPALTLSLLFWFIYFVCKYFPTRSEILASPLCIRLSISVLCRLSLHWPLLLFAGCVFILNKNFILFRSAFMGNLWDED